MQGESARAVLALPHGARQRALRLLKQKNALFDRLEFQQRTARGDFGARIAARQFQQNLGPLAGKLGRRPFSISRTGKLARQLTVDAIRVEQAAQRKRLR